MSAKLYGCVRYKTYTSAKFQIWVLSIAVYFKLFNIFLPVASSPNITYIENTTVPLVSVPYFIIAGFLTLVIISLILLKFFASLDSTESQDENTIEQEGTRYRFDLVEVTLCQKKCWVFQPLLILKKSICKM